MANMTVKLRVERAGVIASTPDYWDCECKDNFIHPKHERICVVCGSIPDEQPDSQVNEVKDFLRSKGLRVRMVPVSGFY